jgi:hypothetical protein
MGIRQVSDIWESCGKRVVVMLTGGFEDLIEDLGGECLGISIRSHQYQSLLVIRADFPGGAFVGFVGAQTAAEAVAKAHNQLKNNKLKWKPDKYAKNGRVKNA